MGAAFGLTVSVEDASGNVVAGYSGPVYLGLSSNPGHATFQGSLSATAHAGVATFTGLSISAPASGYVVKAVALGFTTTSGTFTVTPAAAAKVVVTTEPPSSMPAGSTFGLTVAVEDGSGNLAAGYNGPVTLSLSSNPGNAVLHGALSVTASGGVATFKGLSLNTAAAGYILKAVAGSLSATATSLTITPAGVAQVVITNPPPSSVTAGATFGLTVTAEDAFGNVVSSYTGPVTVALASNPGNAVLQGNTTVNAKAGVAVFTGLSLSKPGSGYSLEANLGSVPPNTVQPASQSAGFNYTYQIAVYQQKTIVETDTYVLVAQNDQQAAQAVAAYLPTLGQLLTAAGKKWSALTPSLLSKTAEAPGLLPLMTTSSHITVTSVADTLIVTTQPASATVGSPFGLTVKVEDGSGKAATSFTGNVTLMLGNNPGGATLGGALSVKAVNGVATFSGLTLNKPGAGYTLQVSSSGLTGTATAAFNAVPALVVTSEPPAHLVAGSSFGLTVEVEDASGHQLTSYTGPVTVALSGNSGGLLGVTTVTAHAGLATFSGLSLTKAGSNYILLVTSGNWAVSTPTTSITVAPAAATHLAITTPAPSSVTAGRLFGMTVAAEDAFGNVVSTYSNTVTLSLPGAPAKQASRSPRRLTREWRPSAV